MITKLISKYLKKSLIIRLGCYLSLIILLSCGSSSNNDTIVISGCMDENACNYNENATEQSDCIYETSFVDCMGNCLIDEDIDNICDDIDECIDLNINGDCDIDEEICDDGMDNNSNGQVDCDDGYCMFNPACGESEICNDGIDNDFDTQTDCDDSDCSSSSNC